MTDVLVAVNGKRVTRLRLVVANIGPWHVELDFEDAAARLPTGPVTLQIGALKLKGTLSSSGTFGLQRKARIVAGAGGWGKQLEAKGYHNDAGVKARQVADDAARAAGETIGTFVPAEENLGADYARQVGPASRTLEEAVGAGVAWWVDYDGVTQAGPRPATALAATAYEVLAFNPQTKIATLAVDDPGAVRIGSILEERLDGPQTVREFELTVTPDQMRIRAWCGVGEAIAGRLPGLLRAIVSRASDGRLYGKYVYRVLRMNVDRVELQAVSKAAGLPDLIPVSMWPGVAGVHAQLSPSSEVLVEFIEGKRARPIVTAFAGKDGNGFVPVNITLGGTTGPEAARKGDAVEVLLPPAVFSGTIGGSPASGVLTFTLNKTLGTITAGSTKVKVA